MVADPSVAALIHALTARLLPWGVLVGFLCGGREL